MESKSKTIILELKKEHCVFAELNSAGRCVAFCYYNERQNYMADCTGKGGEHTPQFNEIRLKGRRHE